MALQNSPLSTMATKNIVNRLPLLKINRLPMGATVYQLANGDRQLDAIVAIPMATIALFDGDTLLDIGNRHLNPMLPLSPLSLMAIAIVVLSDRQWIGFSALKTKLTSLSFTYMGQCRKWHHCWHCHNFRHWRHCPIYANGKIEWYNCRYLRSIFDNRDPLAKFLVTIVVNGEVCKPLHTFA